MRHQHLYTVDHATLVKIIYIITYDDAFFFYTN